MKRREGGIALEFTGGGKIKIKKDEYMAVCPCCGTESLVFFGEFECSECGHCEIVEESGE